MLPMYAFRDAMVELTTLTNKLDSICSCIQSWEERSVYDVIDDSDVVAVYMSIKDIIDATERIERKFVVGRSNNPCRSFEVYRRVPEKGENADGND